MIKKKPDNRGEIIIYKAKDGRMAVDVRLREETVWLNTHQMARLFDVDRTGIVRHIRNIYKSQELNKNSTCAKIAQVAKDGKIREMDYYNLDIVISVGYRVNSKRATDFRIWATKTLRSHLLKGYTINERRLKKRNDNLKELSGAIRLLQETINRQLSLEEAEGLLRIITDYTDTWITLQRYDEDRLDIKAVKRPVYKLSYDDAGRAISELKTNLIKKKEASDIFGWERGRMLDGIIKSVHQSFGGKELYPSIESKAAHLLYFVIKDHPFTDGNKRIGCLLFILFLFRNKYLFTKKGEKKFNDNALVALAILVAESGPKQKDLMIGLVMNLISSK